MRCRQHVTRSNEGICYRCRDIPDVYRDGDTITIRGIGHLTPSKALTLAHRIADVLSSPAKPEPTGAQMDPNTALDNMRDAFSALGKRPVGDPDYIDDLLSIAVHVDALDKWLSKGGSLPDAWTPTTVAAQ